MAFTINRQPNEITTAYNHMTFDVSSTNYTETGFRYIFKLYINGSLVSTSKLFPRPLFNCYYDAQPVVKNFVDGTIDLPFSFDTSTAANPYVAELYVEFYEEYEVAGVITESSLLDTSDTIRCYEMVAPYYYDDVDDFIDDYSPQIATYTSPLYNLVRKFSGPNVIAEDSWTDDNSKSILESDTYGITENDFRKISVISRKEDLSNTLTTLRIRTYTNTGENKILDFDLPSTTSDYLDDIMHIPIDYATLNDIGADSSTIPVGLSAEITPSEDDAYSVELLNSVGQYVYRPIIFRITDSLDCNRYQKFTLRYKTPTGGWWYVDCKKKSYETEDASRTVIERKRQYGDDSEYISKPVINMTGSRSYAVNTDWLPSDSHVQDVIDLLNSPSVFIVKEDSSGFYSINIPVIIKTSSFQKKTIKQEKLVQYSIEVEEAFNKKFTI